MFATINDLRHYNLHPFLEMARAYLYYMVNKIEPLIGMCHYLS